MLGLKLREEFLGVNMPGTVIELNTTDKQGAVQRSADYILSITYPTNDVRNALHAISDPQSGRPIVLRGIKGRGKSHIMALMHHAIASPETVETWLKNWSGKGKPELSSIYLLRNYYPISEAVHNYEYTFLWDLIFNRHPNGEFYRGQFAGMNQPVPPRTLLEHMFQDKKTCLILDEFQTWYDSLPQEKDGIKIRANAFNFIQILSEIAKDHPELLVLIVSVRDSNNEAYNQVRRQNPIEIDFLGVEAKQDRQKLLLHRLFENRDNIPPVHIQNICDAYARERNRLIYTYEPPQEQTKKQVEVYSCWPFSPELLVLLENQILLSIVAQETRDLIKILAQLYKSRGGQSPILTPADFFVDGQNDEVQTLITSISPISSPDKLRRIAQDNLASISVTNPELTYAREMISDIWMHSISHDSNNGIDTMLLHLEITRDKPIDDNVFQVELATLIENSTHLLGGDSSVSPVKFSLEENPVSKVRAFAKNENIWDPNAVPVAGQQVYPSADINYIRETLKALFYPEISEPPSKIIVLGPNWRTNPWDEVGDNDKPQYWDRPVLLVIPENIENQGESFHTILGAWLIKHLSKRRNTVRFLLAKNNLFSDKNLILLSRCCYLCSKKAWGQDRNYHALHNNFYSSFETDLKSRFDHYAILQQWDFQNAKNCLFEIQRLSVQGRDIPKAVEETILNNYFDFEEFKTHIIDDAKNTSLIKDIINNYIEPPPTSAVTITPYLKEEQLCDLIFQIASSGAIVINSGGTWVGRRADDIDDNTSYKRIRQLIFRTVNEMKNYQLALPGAAGSAAPIAPPPSGSFNTPHQSGLNPVYPLGADGLLEDSSATQPLPPYSAQPVQPPEIQPVSQSQTKDAGPASSINLMGKLEEWSLSANEPIENLTLGFADLDAAKIKQILQRIPSSFQVTMSITYKENDSVNGGHQ
jgi:hypothetical protein